MRIYLSGFMASGKSTVGPILARELGYDFMDLDDAIEEAAGRSIPEIFAIEGELGFRQRETEALWQTADRDDLVVALGGGTIVDDANREWALDHGLVVTLDVDAGTLLDRLGDEADHRPLLQDEEGRPLGREAMRRRIEQMLSERRSAYAQAHATVDATRPPEVVAAVIAEVATVWRHRQ
jgi:shikimate kinase